MIRTVPSRNRRVVLVCGKCSRKLGGGFGKNGCRSLAKALRRKLGDGKPRRSEIAVLEVKCLDLCPKNAVALIDAARPEHWYLVPPGSDLEEMADRLTSGS